MQPQAISHNRMSINKWTSRHRFLEITDLLVKNGDYGIAFNFLKSSLPTMESSSNTPSNPVPLPPSSEKRNGRSLSWPIHITVVTLSSFSFGLIFGAAYGGKESSLRFRAENAHRFPTSTTGWYLYHKSKNYHVMLGGIKGGLKMGSKIAFWTGSIVLIEEAVNRRRGRSDFCSTVVAGVGTAGGFSLLRKFLTRPPKFVMRRSTITWVVHIDEYLPYRPISSYDSRSHD